MDHYLLGDLPEINLFVDEETNERKVQWLEAAQNIQELVKEVRYTIDHPNENPFLRKKSYKKSKTKH